MNHPSSPLALRAFQRSSGQRPYIYGHRGARATHPENTILAFEQALSQGADGVELDVRMAADGGLFVTHDDALPLAPARGGEGARRRHNPPLLSRLSSEQVRRLRTESGEPVPSLSDALLFQAQSGCLMNVELKGDVLQPWWMARRVSECLRAHGGHHILLSSFHPGIVWALARQVPSIPVALLVHEQQSWQRRLWPVQALGASVVHPEAQLLDAALMQRLRKRVSVVNAWTVNDPSEGLRLSRLGVDGLVTDRPGVLRAALAAT